MRAPHPQPCLKLARIYPPSPPNNRGRPAPIRKHMPQRRRGSEGLRRGFRGGSERILAWFSERGSEGAPKGFRGGSEGVGVPRGFPRGSEGAPKGFRRGSEGVPKGFRRGSEGVPK
eukprot:15454731-Alexandrium_andersonii.AAC.1